MSKNVLYMNEIATAGTFVREHSNDLGLKKLIEDLKHPYYTHSDRWSIIYDYLNEHYDNLPDGVVTGLSYYVED